MKTIEDIRRDWLLRLIERFGSIAELNERLHRPRTDATLSQIKNKAPNTKTGKIRSMGSDLAREIEEKLNLEIGVIDQDPEIIEKLKSVDFQNMNFLDKSPAHDMIEIIRERSKIIKMLSSESILSIIFMCLKKSDDPDMIALANYIESVLHKDGVKKIVA